MYRYKRPALCLFLALLAGCAATPPTPDCAAAEETALAYPALLQFQRELNDATRDLSGAWEAGLPLVFARLDRTIGQLQAGAGEGAEACGAGHPASLTAQLARLQGVRSRGEAYLEQVRGYLRERREAVERLRQEGITEARISVVKVELQGVDEDGQRLRLGFKNLARRTTHWLVTHYGHRYRDGQGEHVLPRPAHFVLVDEFANHYPLLEISPAHGADAPLVLGPGEEASLSLRFDGPFVAQARKLTLMVDASLMPSNAEHMKTPPAVLVLPTPLVSAVPQPVFVAEPGR